MGLQLVLLLWYGGYTTAHAPVRASATPIKHASASSSVALRLALTRRPLIWTVRCRAGVACSRNFTLSHRFVATTISTQPLGFSYQTLQ